MKKLIALNLSLFLFITVIFYFSNEQVEHDPFVVLTPPKSGTHLLTKVLSLITQKNHYHLGRSPKDTNEMDVLMEAAEQNHLFFDNHAVTPDILEMLKTRGYKILTMKRDPRDQLLSLLNWNLNGNWPALPLEDLTKEEQIDELIYGTRFGFRAVDDLYEGNYRLTLISKLPSSMVYTSQFEHLVGPEGGGDREKQIEEILSISRHIGIDLTAKKAEEIARQTYGRTNTFHKGKIGKWKLEFSEKNKQHFNSEFRKIVRDWGYATETQKEYSTKRQSGE